MSAIKAAFFTGNPGNIDYVYGKGRRELVARETELYPEVITPENFHQHREALTEVEVIFSTWGFWAFSEEEFAARRAEEAARGSRAFSPHSRSREVSKALKAYAKLVSSADKGAVRIIE